MDSFFVQPPFCSRLYERRDKLETNTNTIVFTQSLRTISNFHATVDVDATTSSADFPGVSSPDLTVESYKLSQLGPIDSDGNRVLYQVYQKENGITATIKQLNANAVPRVT